MAETKARKLSYERRAACILKKAMELQTLCDLKIGVVILSPDGKLESWPPQLNDVKALLHACKERGPRGKEIATGGETLVRSKKRKDFGEQGCLEILNSKLELLKKREMLFLNHYGKEIVSMEGIESQSLCDGVVLAYGQEEGDVLTQNLYDEFFFNNGGNAATFKGKEIATMDSGILQHTAQIPNQWHYGSSRVNSTLQAGSDRFEACYPPQNSFTALGNGLPSTVTASEECGELQKDFSEKESNLEGVAMAETKARKLSYERRAACILKKAMELQTLCDLKIGVVILSPDGKLESWPPDLNDVKALLDACKERGPRVKSDNRKEDCREILVSKLHLLNQREELFKGKHIATGGETLVRSKKTKDFGEQGCLEILNSKLQLLKKREMLFLNHSGKEIVSMEGIESQSLPCDGVVLAYGQEEGDVLTQNLYDEFFFNNGGNAATFKGKEIATMDSGILQHTAQIPNQWHYGSSRVNSTLQAGSDRFEACYPPQNSFTALGNSLPSTSTATASKECGELQVSKKARLQYPTAALNNNLPQFTPEDYWEAVFTDVVNSTDDVMLSLLEDL
nr:agamous-like MADS-box protein AGL81 [Ipomoea batatas]